MRRYVEHLKPEDVKHMFATGLMSEAVARTALRERVADALMAAASTAPSAALSASDDGKMTPVIAKAAAARALYATYPSTEKGFACWSKAADRILGSLKLLAISRSKHAVEARKPHCLHVWTGKSLRVLGVGPVG